MKTKLLVICSMGVIGTSTLELKAIAGSEPLTTDLRDYSITFIPRHADQDRGEAQRFIKHSEIMAKTEPAIFACRDAFPSKPGVRYFTLQRPDASNIVAIVRVDTDGRCMLNPESSGDYGPIPSLGTLSLSQADLLWGPPVQTKSVAARSYHLIFVGKGSELNFHLDVEFQNQHVLRYKLSCDSDKTILSDWHSV